MNHLIPSTAQHTSVTGKGAAVIGYIFCFVFGAITGATLIMVWACCIAAAREDMDDSEGV